MSCCVHAPGFERERAGQPDAQTPAVGVAGKQGLEPRRAPQAHLADARLEHGVVVRVAVGDREGAQLLAGRFRALRVQAAQLEAEGQAVPGVRHRRIALAQP